VKKHDRFFCKSRCTEWSSRYKAFSVCSISSAQRNALCVRAHAYWRAQQISELSFELFAWHCVLFCCNQLEPLSRHRCAVRKAALAAVPQLHTLLQVGVFSALYAKRSWSLLSSSIALALFAGMHGVQLVRRRRSTRFAREEATTSSFDVHLA
jgi:hypothetical protein